MTRTNIHRQYIDRNTFRCVFVEMKAGVLVCLIETSILFRLQCVKTCGPWRSLQPFVKDNVSLGSRWNYLVFVQVFSRRQIACRGAKYASRNWSNSLFLKCVAHHLYPFSNNISLYQVFEIWYFYIIACDMHLGVSHIYNEFGIKSTNVYIKLNIWIVVFRCSTMHVV